MLYRRLLAVLLIAAMVGFGFGVHHFLGGLRSQTVTAKAVAPTATKPKFALPGTIFVAQGGALYRLQGGAFASIGTGGWTMPAAAPGGRLVAVMRQNQASDLFVLDANGAVQAKLTRNAARDVPANHWAFYPHVSPDGQTLFYSWDPKDPNGNLFRVDLTVYAMAFPGGPQSRAVPWTVPNQYTGGDVQPVPLPGGVGVVYTKFGIDSASQTFSDLYLTRQPRSAGVALTDPADDCSAPAVAPAGDRVAMICTSGTQVARLEVAPLQGDTLGPATVVAQGLVAAPAWSPDGTGLLFYQGVAPSGHFQLFYSKLGPAPAPVPAPSPGASASASPAPAGPPPPAPRQLTTDNDFDATSAPVWVA